MPDTSSPRPSPAQASPGEAPPRLVPVWWLVLMASPVAAANNATVLILDDIGEGLGTTIADAAWLATVFGLILAVATPLQAALMRHRGQRTVLFTSAALVATGTIVVLLSPWLSLAIAAARSRQPGVPA